MTTRNNELAVVEARVKSADWLATQGLAHLIHGGHGLLPDDFAEQLQGMSPDRRERATKVCQQWQELAFEVQALVSEVNAQIEEEVAS